MEKSMRHLGPSKAVESGRKPKTRLAWVIAIIVIGSALAPTSPTFAANISPMSCSDMGWHYAVSGKADTHLPTGTDWKSGPGGTVSSSLEYSQATAITVSASFSYSVSSIVSAAQATYGISAAATSSKNVSYTYTHAVTAGKYGHLQFGNWGWSMNFQKYYLDNYCTTTSSSSGVVNRMPSANSWGFRYWETNS